MFDDIDPGGFQLAAIIAMLVERERMRLQEVMSGLRRSALFEDLHLFVAEKRYKDSLQ